MDNITARRTAMSTPIHRAQELDQFWHTMMGPLGFTRRKLWVLFLADDGLPVPQLMEIEDVPSVPDAMTCESLMSLCEMVLDDVIPGGSVALLLTRPGSDQMSDTDRAWARTLIAAAASEGVELWPVHMANDVLLQVFAPDDLLWSKAG